MGHKKSKRNVYDRLIAIFFFQTNRIRVKLAIDTRYVEFLLTHIVVKYSVVWNICKALLGSNWLYDDKWNEMKYNSTTFSADEKIRI